MKQKIVVVGSLHIDFVINVPHFPSPGETVVGSNFQVFPGGKGANQAYAAAKLGGSVSMVGQVGGDAQADWLKKNLASVGVDVSAVRRDPKNPSGTAGISIDPSGQNQILIMPGANGTFGPAQLKESKEILESAGIVLLQLEIPLETVEAAVHLANKAGAVVMLDPAPARDLPDSLLHLVDYLTPNENELAALTGAPPSAGIGREHAVQRARILIERGANKVIVKMGPHGALLVTKDQEHFWPVVSVEVVDTTAAGDAFNAAFAVALVAGKSEMQAGQFATAAGACSVTRQGAQPSMPTRNEVELMMKVSGHSAQSGF
ncbi:MAG TPA: ribokinase [Acidobacteriota bacterium]|jgi:ribokinase